MSGNVREREATHAGSWYSDNGESAYYLESKDFYLIKRSIQYFAISPKRSFFLSNTFPFC